MLALVISSLLIIGALSATCNECWDEYSTCEWNAESSAWDQCSQVWEQGSGYAPFNKECIEQQSQTAVQCYTNAGCFEAGNQDCWWKLWDLGCSPYKCEAYTICYENHKNEAGCDQQLQTCEQDCDDSDYDYGYDSGYNSGYDSGSYYYDDSGYDHNYDYYGSYNDNYYGSYDYNYYDEEWEYAEEEIPECIKEACETQLNQCASSDACIQGIENMVNQCYAEYEGSMECMDNLITESQGNGALELCEQNQECATDLQALGECVIQSANYGYCQEEETEKVKPKLLAKAVEAIKNKKANQLKRKNAALRNKQRTKQRQRPRSQRRPASRPRPVQRQRQRPERQRGRPSPKGRSRRKLLSSGCCECTDPKKGPFCNEECDKEICPLDSYCCKYQWDWICADAAENVCNDEEAYGDTSSYNPYDYSAYDSYSGYDYSSNYDSYSYPSYDYSPYDYSPYDYSSYSGYDYSSYSPYDYSGYDYSSNYDPYSYQSYDYSPYDPYSLPSDYSPYDFYGDDSYVPPSKRKVRARGRVQRRSRPHLRRRQRRGRRVRRVRPRRGVVRQQRVRSKVQARQRHGLQRRARQQRSRLALLRRARQERQRKTRPAPKRKSRRKLQSSEGCCECTDAKGSAFCNPECDAEICPLDSYCCNNSWDWICANAASNVCDGQDAYNYGSYSWDEPSYTPNEYGSDNSGSCCECTSSKGEAYCNSACDQAICPLDPYCCNNQWDWICADAASNVCNGQDAYGYNSYDYNSYYYPSYDYSSYDNYNYPSYDYSSYDPYSYSYPSYDYSGYDSYNYPSYDYSSYDYSSYNPYYYPTPSPGYGYSSYDYSSYDPYSYSSYDHSGYDSYGYNYPNYDYSSYDSGYDNYYYPSYDYSGYDSYGSDYGYDNYDYSGYDYSGYDSCGPDSCGSGYDEPEEWEYDEEEIPTCIKEACGTELAQCASSEACIEGIEGIANGCYNDNESPVECMNTLIIESEGNGALGLCNGNEQCATDLQALGECVIQSANYGLCENEPVKKKKELLKGLVKGLLTIKKQRVEGLKRRNKQKMAERKRREQRRVRPRQRQRPRPRPRPVRRERLSREERLRRDRARKASLARGASLARRGRLQRRHRLRPRPRVERRERRDRK